MPDVRTSTLDGELGVELVEVCRPPHNFFDAALIADIADEYERLAADGRTRVIVLASEGKNFCAGANFAAGHVFGDHTRVLYGHAARLMAAELPVVCAVQGAAVGGGLGLAMSADFRIGTTTTRFAAPFTMLGIHHGFGLSLTLPPVLGDQRTKELLYSGGEISGPEVQASGLCDRFVDDPVELRSTALAFARAIASSAPLAVRAVRQTLRADLIANFEAATRRELAEQARLSTTSDSEEAHAAARSRRAPRFEGR